MERFFIRILRRYATRFAMRSARRGIGKAMSAGGKAVKNRKTNTGPTIDQDPSVTQSRQRFADERRGDEILYPTDAFTHDMQPRK